MTKASEQERLASAIEALTDNVSVLRESIDEFRTAIRWGNENDKFQGTSESSEATDGLASVVEATIREEMSAVQNSLTDFSIDMQWAVRQIRQASDKVERQLLLFRADD